MLYSANGGTSWQVIAIDLSGSSVSVPRCSLPGSTHAHPEVIAGYGVTFSLPDLAHNERADQEILGRPARMLRVPR
ncbi:hypothetical protein [Nucisporomicrobium flavum]|uniref:hypothetical protein n=1 Tax=Nucisporomicrobium flavum TaxID=2785915 RepID=UPI0018F4225B|nr:hypothetical protein [Nucisporomicrobium flavum]